VIEAVTLTPAADKAWLRHQRFDVAVLVEALKATAVAPTVIVARPPMCREREAAPPSLPALMSAAVLCPRRHPRRRKLPLAFDAVAAGCCNAWLAIDFAVSTSFDSEVMPVLAAAAPARRCRCYRAGVADVAARASRPEAVKKLVGLSSALLTSCGGKAGLVVESRLAYPASESRFWRTEDERVMLERRHEHNLSGVTQRLAFLRTRARP